MNTTEFGNIFEKQVYKYLSDLIAADLFWARKESCKIFWKKAYYSSQRGANIVFDVAIEVWMPGASEYSLLILVECKRYTTRGVPVDDIEEFFQKVQQVSAANRKAVLASNSAFDTGTRNFAKSNGFALLRYLDQSNPKWELHRSPSLTATSSNKVQIDRINEALSHVNYQQHAMDLYMQSGDLLTNSFWDFTEDLICRSTLSLQQIQAIRNQVGKPSMQVPFLDDGYLEDLAIAVLRDTGYEQGEVSLAQICALEGKRSGLLVHLNASPNKERHEMAALGKISFAPLEIRIFEQEFPNVGRERFTLAHELAHHFLGHSAYISGEYCDDSDFALKRSNRLLGPEIARLEYQANYVASCMLMPKKNFINDFKWIAHRLDINNKGFGALYVDNQPCNCENFYRVTSAMMQIYAVSRAAVAIRLETFDLLRDVRSPAGMTFT